MIDRNSVLHDQITFIEHLRPCTVLRVIKIDYVYFPLSLLGSFYYFLHLEMGKLNLRKINELSQYPVASG